MELEHENSIINQPVVLASARQFRCSVIYFGRFKSYCPKKNNEDKSNGWTRNTANKKKTTKTKPKRK